MTLTLSRTILSAVLRGERIELRGPFHEQLNEFYSSLPGGRWNKALLCWTCEPTPAACWRITAQAPCDVEADDEITALAHRFYEPVLRPIAERQPAIQIGQAWGHQARMYSFAFDRDATLFAAWMGTGKSRVAVNLADNWSCRRVLIVCPVSVRGVWRREIAKHSPRDWQVTVLESGDTVKKTATALLDVTRAQARGLPIAVVVNYDTAKLGAFAKWSLSIEWDLVIADESHRFKGATTAVSKYMADLGRVAKRRLALTGTPMSHSPLDLFGQFRFLDRGIFGTSWHRFRATFAVNGPLGSQHIVGFKNQDELARRMALITFQVGAEVLDLPEAQHIDLPVELEPESRRVYDEMKDDLIAFLKDGGQVTAPNGLVKLLRLSQITGGFCKGDDGVERLLGHEKRNALADLLEDLNEPVVVCCRFIRDLDTVREVSEAAGRRYGELSGRLKDGLTPNATMADVDVLGVQIQAGGVGVDLSRARIAVLWSVGYSLGEYEQFLARVHRPGQTRPVVYYHLVAENSVDRVVYKALQKKKDVVEAVLGYLRHED